MGFERNDRFDRRDNFDRDRNRNSYNNNDRNNDRGGSNDRRGGYGDRNGGGGNRYNNNNSRPGGGDDDRRFESVFSEKVRAGKRRTYFFDVHKTKGDDYYLTITESTKSFDERYTRHKIFVYKEDFNRFIEALNSTVNHVKNELLPDYDYDEFARRYSEEENAEYERRRDSGEFERKGTGFEKKPAPIIADDDIEVPSLDDDADDVLEDSIDEVDTNDIDNDGDDKDKEVDRW